MAATFAAALSRPAACHRGSARNHVFWMKNKAGVSYSEDLWLRVLALPGPCCGGGGGEGRPWWVAGLPSCAGWGHTRPQTPPPQALAGNKLFCGTLWWAGVCAGGGGWAPRGASSSRRGSGWAASGDQADQLDQRTPHAYPPNVFVTLLPCAARSGPEFCKGDDRQARAPVPCNQGTGGPHMLMK